MGINDVIVRKQKNKRPDPKNRINISTGHPECQTTIMKRILLLTLGISLLLTVWYVTEERDYFKATFHDLTALEASAFTKEANPAQAYTAHFGDDNFTFPRQTVDKIKLFENNPLIGTLTSKTLKQEFNPDVLEFFNDPANFSWGETTWSVDESEYILRFYNQNKIVGKIYLCLNDCGRIETRPFTPNVKFGGLTDIGQKTLETMLHDKKKWE
jgi:hypothetical protein